MSVFFSVLLGEHYRPNYMQMSPRVGKKKDVRLLLLAVFILLA